MNLSELITVRCCDLGDLSHRRVAEIATEAGYPMTGGTVSRLAGTAILSQAPYGDTLRGLAIALQVEEHVVGRAAVESMGLRWEDVVATVTDNGDLTFAISGHGWNAKQLEAFRRVGERAVRRAQQREVQRAQSHLAHLPKRRPNG